MEEFILSLVVVVAAAAVEEGAMGVGGRDGRDNAVRSYGDVAAQARAMHRSNVGCLDIVQLLQYSTPHA